MVVFKYIFNNLLEYPNGIEIIDNYTLKINLKTQQPSFLYQLCLPYGSILPSEVVEHFFKPFEEFSKIDSLLAPNSWLAIMTSFMTENYLFKNWYYRKDPTHVVFYKKITFKIIAHERNWKINFPSKNVVLFNKK